MSQAYGYTKPGGNAGIDTLKQMHALNKQIMAISDDLKIHPNPNPIDSGSKEGFTSQTSEKLAKLSDSIKTDEVKINKIIQDHNQLEVDQSETQRVLLYSRIKYGVAVVLGLLLAYFAYRFLTADELSKEITGQNAADAIQGSYEMNSPK
jgi:hypothetical protein